MNVFSTFRSIDFIFSVFHFLKIKKHLKRPIQERSIEGTFRRLIFPIKKTVYSQREDLSSFQSFPFINDQKCVCFAIYRIYMQFRRPQQHINKVHHYYKISIIHTLYLLYLN